MADSIELARKVFSAFQHAHDQHAADPSVSWAINLYAGDEDALELGLSQHEIGLGLRVLKQKDLVRAFTSDSYKLTDIGEECCLHPELLNDYLAPRRGAAAPSVVISGGHVQIGDNNTQTITYRSILQQALATAEEREDVPAPIAAALRRLHEYPDVEALMTEAAVAAGAK